MSTITQTLTPVEIHMAEVHAKDAVRRYRAAVKWQNYAVNSMNNPLSDGAKRPQRFSKDSKHQMYDNVGYLTRVMGRDRAESLPDVYETLLAARAAGFISAGTTIPAPPASTFINVTRPTV